MGKRAQAWEGKHIFAEILLSNVMLREGNMAFSEGCFAACRTGPQCGRKATQRRKRLFASFHFHFVRPWVGREMDGNGYALMCMNVSVCVYVCVCIYTNPHRLPLGSTLVPHWVSSIVLERRTQIKRRTTSSEATRKQKHKGTHRKGPQETVTNGVGVRSLDVRKGAEGRQKKTRKRKCRTNGRQRQETTLARGTGRPVLCVGC